MERLLELNEVQEILHIKRTALYRLLNTDYLPSIKIGRKRLVRESDLEDLINQNIGKSIEL